MTIKYQPIETARIEDIDRSEVARCLAKAIAYKRCGKDGEAAHWARKLIEALELAQILRPGA